MYQELAKQFINECVNPERTLSEREVNLIDSFAIYLQLHAAQQNVQPTIESGRVLPAPRNIKSDVMLLANSG